MNTALAPFSIPSQTWEEHETSLGHFDLATPELLASRELQTRVDTKFVVPAARLGRLLELMRADFALLAADGAVHDRYTSVYYDTPDHRLFEAHRLGRRPRHKVRVRHYARRDLCYLEVKTKSKYDVTSKFRIKRPALDFGLSEGDRTMISERLGIVDDLVAVAQIEFPRVTLLGLGHEERVTLDLGLHFHVGDREVDHSGVVIAEIKQARFWPRSPGFQAFRAIGVRPFSISKFCIAIAELGDVPRNNQFRPALRALHKLDHE